MTDELTHTTDEGDVQMVDVGSKPDTARRAVARGEIHLSESTIEAIREDEIGKGDVLATARIGAVQAVKHTWETIPMCHQIPITNVDTEFEVEDDRVTLEVAVETTGKTGCEMEAIQGVTTGLGVVWDMVKAAEKREARSASNRSGDSETRSVSDHSSGRSPREEAAEEDEDGPYPGTAIRDVRVVEKRKRRVE